MSSANLALKIKEHEDRLSRIERIVEANALAIEKLHQEMLAFKEEGERERRRLHEEMLAFKEEMRAFKDEMLEFKNEMKAFKDEMRAFKDEMLEFKNGVEAFKEGMGEFKDWCKGQIREMNKQWGNLANKFGTLLEDIAYPAARPAIKKYFGCDPEFLAIRVRRKRAGVEGEFDIVAICERERRVFLFEVRSTTRAQYIDEVKERKEKFKLLFPEHANKKITLIFVSLYIDEKFVDLLTEAGIYAMAYREWEYMDILNFDELSRLEDPRS